MTQGGVSARMEKYASKTIKEFLEDITASVVILGVDGLFDVSETTVRLELAEVRAFHRST